MSNSMNHVSGYFTNQQLAKFQAIRDYFAAQPIAGQVYGDSAIINQLVNEFYELFIQNDSARTRSARHLELLKGQSNNSTSLESTKKILSDLNTIKRQLDTTSYVGLGIYQMVKNDEVMGSFDPKTQLVSMFDRSNLTQKNLLERVADLAKADRARGQTTKSSHQGRKRVE